MKQAPGSEPSAQSPRGARTHGPRDRDLAEVGPLTDCATQAHPTESFEHIIQFSPSFLAVLGDTQADGSASHM